VTNRRLGSQLTILRFRGILARTLKDHFGVPDGMNHSLNSSNARNPAMKIVVRAKTPASQPHKKMIARSKKPDKGEVRKCDGASPIRDVSPELRGYQWPIKITREHAVANATEDEIDDYEREDREALNPGRNCAPAEVL
jgi:hypothetical protein